MTATDLSAAAGVLISLMLSYTPGLREKWAAQTAEFKSLCMFGSLAAISVALFAGSCADLWFAATCDRDGALNLLRVFVAALVANQGAYLISPPVPTVKQIKLRTEVKEEKQAVSGKLPALLLMPLLFAATVGVANADGDASPAFADTFPQSEEYCLAAAVHTEAASQSVEAKAAIARWILVRAIERQQTVCRSLRSERTVIAAHAAPGTWAWYVFHHGDLLQRQRGPESWLIALSVYDAAAIGGEIYAHWDSCDTRAAWAAFYERVRFMPTDSMCFWK